jgi:hypothetical protein
LEQRRKEIQRNLGLRSPVTPGQPFRRNLVPHSPATPGRPFRRNLVPRSLSTAYQLPRLDRGCIIDINTHTHTHTNIHIHTTERIPKFSRRCKRMLQMLCTTTRKIRTPHLLIAKTAVS